MTFVGSATGRCRRCAASISTSTQRGSLHRRRIRFRQERRRPGICGLLPRRPGPRLDCPRRHRGDRRRSPRRCGSCAGRTSVSSSRTRPPPSNRCCRSDARSPRDRSLTAELAASAAARARSNSCARSTSPIPLAGRAVSAPVLRRHAPARGDRDGDGRAAQTHHRGRTHDGARRDRAGAGARRCSRGARRKRARR